MAAGAASHLQASREVRTDDTFICHGLCKVVIGRDDLAVYPVAKRSDASFVHIVYLG